MGYYLHLGCGGRVSVRTRKCAKCGEKWPITALFALTVPKNLSKYIIEKKPATYSKWADKLPGVGSFASRLPSWPRWARIAFAISLLIGVSYLITCSIRGF